MRMKEALQEALATGRPCVIVEASAGDYRVEQIPYSMVVVVDASGFPTALNSSVAKNLSVAVSDILSQNKRLMDTYHPEAVKEDEDDIAKATPPKPKKKLKKLRSRT